MPTRRSTWPHKTIHSNYWRAVSRTGCWLSYEGAGGWGWLCTGESLRWLPQVFECGLKLNITHALNCKKEALFTCNKITSEVSSMDYGVLFRTMPRPGRTYRDCLVEIGWAWHTSLRLLVCGVRCHQSDTPCLCHGYEKVLSCSIWM